MSIFAQEDTLQFTEEEFYEFLGHLTWTTMLSDGRSTVELVPGGRHRRVQFDERWEYSRLALQARLHGTALQMRAMREGLHTVVSAQALTLLSWKDLELRVCGVPTIDLDVLAQHTVYSPARYTAETPIIQNFWKVMASFGPKEHARFLQFAWARSRLPSEMGSYRMQINIVESSMGQMATDMLLPMTETCFFNVNLPKYSSMELMREKLLVGLTCSTITS